MSQGLIGGASGIAGYGDVGTAAMAGLGDGLSKAGALMMKFSEDSAELDRKLEERRQEVLWRIEEQRAAREDRNVIAQMTLASRGSSGSGGTKGVDWNDPKERDRYGMVEPGDIDKSQFTKDKITISRADDPAAKTVDPNTGKTEDYSDAVSRSLIKTAMSTESVPDEAGYRSARERAQADNRRIKTEVDKPEAYDDLQKGKSQEKLNTLADRAMRIQDPAAREELVKMGNELSSMLNGKGERFKIEGDNVIDTARGEARPTELGKAKAADEYASAGEHSAKAKNAGKEASTNLLKALHEERVGADNAVTAAQKSLRDYDTNFSKLTSTQQKEATKSGDRAALVAKVEVAQDRAEAIGKRIAKVSGGDDEKPADKSGADQKKPPDISTIKGAPAGATTGAYVVGRGWEIKVNGKVIGYAGK